MSLPERMCVVCRTMRHKSDLIRIVKSKDGVILCDDSGKMQGRGAYICKSRECADRLLKTKGFERSFKCKIPLEIYDAINQKIGE